MTDVSPEIADHVVDSFNRAALGLVPWQDVLVSTAKNLGASKAQFIGIGKSMVVDGFHKLWEMPPDYWRKYIDHYHSVDVWLKAGNAILGDRPRGVLTDMMLGVDEEFMRSEIWADLGKPFGIGHGVFFEDRRLTFGPPGVGIRLGYYRSRGKETFGRAHLNLMSRILKSLPATMALVEQSWTSQSAGRAALHLLQQSRDLVVFADGNGKIVHASEPALRVLALEGFLSTVSGDRHLNANFRDVGRSRGGNGSFIAVGASRKRYLVRRYPVPLRIDGFAGAAQATVVLQMQDLTGGELVIDFDAAKATFALTAAECRLLQHLCRGHGVAAAAVSFGVSVETTRSQLKAILRKTGAQGQPSLISQMFRQFALAIPVSVPPGANSTGRSTDHGDVD